MVFGPDSYPVTIGLLTERGKYSRARKLYGLHGDEGPRCPSQGVRSETRLKENLNRGRRERYVKWAAGIVRTGPTVPWMGRAECHISRHLMTAL